MKKLPKGTRRLCGALLELNPTGNTVYVKAIAEARQSVGGGYGEDAEPARLALVTAIEKNVINQKKWPYELLKRKYGLLESRDSFGKEKDLYCVKIMQGLKIKKGQEKNRC